MCCSNFKLLKFKSVTEENIIYSTSYTFYHNGFVTCNPIVIVLPNKLQGFISLFWDDDPYPWHWEFKRENAKNWDFLVLLALLSNHKIHQII